MFHNMKCLKKDKAPDMAQVMSRTPELVSYGWPVKSASAKGDGITDDLPAIRAGAATPGVKVDVTEVYIKAKGRQAWTVCANTGSGFLSAIDLKDGSIENAVSRLIEEIGPRYLNLLPAANPSIQLKPGESLKCIATEAGPIMVHYV